MKITIFGGAEPHPGSAAYTQAQHLGEMLAKSGHTVITGGYIGTMEAASRGAAEAGGHVIGVTCVEIENYRKIGPNPWVKEEWRCQTLTERLDKLISGCEAAIALPGGPGTLTEIGLMWNQMIINTVPVKPLILVGETWGKTFSTYLSLSDGYFSQKIAGMLSFAKDEEEAVRKINGEG